MIQSGPMTPIGCCAPSHTPAFTICTYSIRISLSPVNLLMPKSRSLEELLPSRFYQVEHDRERPRHLLSSFMLLVIVLVS